MILITTIGFLAMFSQQWFIKSASSRERALHIALLTGSLVLVIVMTWHKNIKLLLPLYILFEHISRWGYQIV